MAPSTKAPVIVGLGNPLVDILAQTDTGTVARHALTPGGMHLVESAAAEALYREVGPGRRQSGGSVANTVAHLAGEDVAPRFVGKIGRDDLGEVFSGEFAALDIAFETAPHAEIATGRCVVLVTPDGERTMSTYLGAAQHLAPSDVAESMPDDCDLLFVEGYLWDSPQGAEVIAAAAEKARKGGALVALTPSDSLCVERHRDAMRAFTESSCDVLVGNIDEMSALTGAATPEAALEWARARVGIVALTMSGEGSIVSDAAGTEFVPAEPVARVVDTTGAGDAYAAGLLARLVNGDPVAVAAKRGSELGAAVVQHTGARQGAATTVAA